MDSKASAVKVPTIPVLVKKGNKLSLLKNNFPNNDLLLRCIKVGALTKEQVIYKSVPGDFLRGEFPGLTLFSRLNVYNHTSSTVARFTTTEGSGSIIEKNSNEVVKVIGQNNYDTVFSALCSVISQELRIRALLALLTVENANKKTEESEQTNKSFKDCACQTDETSKNILNTFKVRKRVRRQQFRPYIVKEDDKSRQLKRIIIDPKTPPASLLKPLYSTSVSKHKEIISHYAESPKFVPKTETIEVESEQFPELSGIVNEDSNFSDISIGNISLTSQDSVNIPLLLENPRSLLENVDTHTDLNIVPLTLLDGSVIMVCAKPMDKFHWATPEILQNLSDADRTKLLYHQVIVHWKYCLERDEEGYLPLHHAVMSNDLEFLNRQCAALVKKYGSVDIPGPGNMSALQMSIKVEDERCAAALLRHGADPTLPDDEGRTFFHTAAEMSPTHLQLALEHCRNNARSMLQEDEEQWSPLLEQQSDEQLAQLLLDNICVTCDNQGYSPLMLASKHGNHASARLLVAASPGSVNRPAPGSGSSALYLAVEAACLAAANSQNQTKISEDFLKTIEILMEAGGDPALDNHAGSNVNLLLSEFNIVDLSVLIANKLTAVKYFDGHTFAPSNINSLMLVKNTDGQLNLKEIRTRKPCDEPNESASTSTVTPDAGGKDVCKVNDDRDTTIHSAANVNKTNNASKIEIKEIRTINVKAAAAGGPQGAAGKVPFLVPIAPKLNAGHIIVIPKKPQLPIRITKKVQHPKKAVPKADVPKFVKILPKVDDETGNAEVVVERKRDVSKTYVKNVKDKAETTTISKTDDCEPTAGKKRRTDTNELKEINKTGSGDDSNIDNADNEAMDINDG